MGFLFKKHKKRGGGMIASTLPSSRPRRVRPSGPGFRPAGNLKGWWPTPPSLNNPKPNMVWEKKVRGPARWPWSKFPRGKNQLLQLGVGHKKSQKAVCHLRMDHRPKTKKIRASPGPAVFRNLKMFLDAYFAWTLINFGLCWLGPGR